MDRKQLKASAKAVLGGKYFSSEWVTAILFTLVSSLLICIVPGIGTMIVMGPVSYAIAKEFLRVSRQGGKVEIASIFDGFKDDFAGTFLISFFSGIFVALWSLLFIIPGIVAGLKYSQAYYIKSENPEMSAMDCIKKSKEMMKGHCGEYFVLQLSFIGFAIVGSLLFGLGTLWLPPYMGMSGAFFYRKLKGELPAQNAGAQYTAPQYAAPRGAAPQYAAPQYAAPQGAAPQYAAPQYTAPQGAAPQGAAPQYANPQGTAPQYTAPQGAAPQYANPQGTAPQYTAPQGANPQPGNNQYNNPQG